MFQKFRLLTLALFAVGVFGLISYESNAPFEPATPAEPGSITQPRTTSITVEANSVPEPVTQPPKSDETPRRNQPATPDAAAEPARSDLTQNNFPEKLAASGDIVTADSTYPSRDYVALAMPNDPAADQWWVTQTGLPAAWEYGQGVGTSIAIIDTGFALEHEEFAGRWLDNSAESGTGTLQASSRLNCTARSLPLTRSCNNIDDNRDGIVDNETGATSQENKSWLNCTDRGQPITKDCNGIDDDNNGLVDDFRGWDFNAGDSSSQAGEINGSGAGVFHGTAVAGVAAATGGNGVGIAGVSWGTKILPLQALGDDGSGSTLSISRAIRYAADRGVDVINLSLGSTQEDPYTREAILYANNKGAIVVAAAGNDGCECLSYPARYPEVFAVGARNADGSIASFSSYGNNIDIIAPGSGMQAPTWSAAIPRTGYARGFAGTSFAAPYVTGLLVNARAKQPQASWDQLSGALLQSADHRTLTVSSPHSTTLGFGYVLADTLMARVSNAYSRTVRYSFVTDIVQQPGTTAAVQCEAGDFPTSRFYEIRQGTAVSYTANESSVYQLARVGATVTQKGYVCTGLPTDQADFVRSISPERELSNASNKPN